MSRSLSDRPLRIAIIGAGSRGCHFADLISGLPHLAGVVAIAEPDAAKAGQLAARLGVPSEACFPGWQALLHAGLRIDAAVIATMDREHTSPAVACLRAGLHVLLEKPMAPTMDECEDIVAAQEASGRMMAVCHSMRYNKVYAMVRRLLGEGVIGRVASIDLLEQVGYWHQAHSFVRGNWGVTDRAVPMILAKSCHDLDYLAFLAGAPAIRLASFGSLGYFTAENAPPGAPARCSDGCPHESTCAYSALRQYVHTGLRAAWPASVCSPTDHSLEAHLAAVRSGPYGRCVWRCDNDAVDHQVVALEFPSGITATFTMTGLTWEGGRRLRVHGGEGVLELSGREITVRSFATGDIRRIELAEEPGGHGGGDRRLLIGWLEAVRSGDASTILTGARESLRTHAMAYAAEISRVERRMVELTEVAPKGASGVPRS